MIGKSVSLLLFGGYGVVEVECGVGQKVEHEFEALGAFVVGVGHVVVACGEAEEFGHAENALFGLGGGGKAVEIGKVGSIHAYDEVEIFEIALSHLAAVMCELQASASGVGTHARVWKLTDMVVAGSGGVYYPSVLSMMLGNNIEEHTLGGRTTADIAETHHENFHFFFAADERSYAWNESVDYHNAYLKSLSMVSAAVTAALLWPRRSLMRE